MKKQMVFLVLLIAMVLAGCEPGAAEIDHYQAAQAGIGGQPGDLFSSDANARATLAMADAWQKATQAIEQGQIIQITAQAAQAQNEIYIAQATQAAIDNAMATQAAGQLATSTAQAVSTVESLAAQATSQAIYFEATAQAGNLAATQVAQSFEIQTQALALERAKTNNTIRALFWYGLTTLIIGTILAFAGMWAYYRIRVKHYPRGERGQAGYFMIGDKTLVVPELAATTSTNTRRPMVLDLETAGQIKANAQKIEALRAIPPIQRPAFDDYASHLFGQVVQTSQPALSGSTRVHLIDHKVLDDVIDEVSQKLLDSPE